MSQNMQGILGKFLLQLRIEKGLRSLFVQIGVAMCSDACNKLTPSTRYFLSFINVSHGQNGIPKATAVLKLYFRKSGRA